MKSCSANKGRNFAQQPKATALLPLPLADARRRRTMHYHGMLLIHYLALLESIHFDFFLGTPTSGVGPYIIMMMAIRYRQRDWHQALQSVHFDFSSQHSCFIAEEAIMIFLESTLVTLTSVRQPPGLFVDGSHSKIRRQLWDELGWVWFESPCHPPTPSVTEHGNPGRGQTWLDTWASVD